MTFLARAFGFRLPRPETMKERASADGRSKIADGLQVEFPRNPPPSFVNVIVNVNEQPTSGRAFSLVELLAVVGIIAMLSVAAVPVMRGLGGSQSSRATAQILVSALEQARTAAILSGTNAYLALPDGTFTATNYRNCSYAILRNTVDLDGDGLDDFQTNTAAPSPPEVGWILLSKWERLPGDLLFSSNRLTSLTNRISPAVPSPGGGVAGALPAIGFTPGGGLTDASGTAGLLFAPSNKVAAGKAAVADRIEISFYSGRVRYIGLTNNVEF